MLAMWNKPTSHNQNTIGKLPKLRKQTFPNPQVWCATIGSHTHTKKKVRTGQVYSKALKCLENDYGSKKVAFFTSSGEGGDPEKYQHAKVRFVENVLTNYPKVQPIASEAFGGLMKITGRKVIDTLDLNKGRSLNRRLGKKFS